jgi:hypothetical protein
VCSHCGAALAAMPEIDISKLALLDERDAPPSAAGAQSPSVVRPAVPAFAPPHDPGAADDDALGVERSTRAIGIENQWSREKVARQAAAAAPPPRPPRRIAGVVVALVAIGAVIAALVVVMRYQRLPRPEMPGVTHGTGPGSAVSIQITAPDPIDVTVDGVRVGKTPITLHRPPSAQPIQITSEHGTKQIVPDRDQRVDLAP